VTQREKNDEEELANSLVKWSKKYDGMGIVWNLETHSKDLCKVILWLHRGTVLCEKNFTGDTTDLTLSILQTSIECSRPRQGLYHSRYLGVKGQVILQNCN